MRFHMARVFRTSVWIGCLMGALIVGWHWGQWQQHALLPRIPLTDWGALTTILFAPPHWLLIIAIVGLTGVNALIFWGAWSPVDRSAGAAENLSPGKRLGLGALGMLALGALGWWGLVVVMTSGLELLRLAPPVPF